MTSEPWLYELHNVMPEVEDEVPPVKRERCLDLHWFDADPMPVRCDLAYDHLGEHRGPSAGPHAGYFEPYRWEASAP